MKVTKEERLAQRIKNVLITSYILNARYDENLDNRLISRHCGYILEYFAKSASNLNIDELTFLPLSIIIDIITK